MTASSAPYPPSGPPAPPGPPLLPASRLWWFTGPLLLALLAIIVLVAARPVPYLALRPGSARSVEPLITLSAVKGEAKPTDEAPTSDLLFVTVSVRQPAGIEALWYARDRTNDVVPEKVVNGSQSQEQNRTFNLQLMTDSKDKAAKVALERAGYTVKLTTTGAVVTDLDPSYPVAKVLQPSDTIVAADGKRVTKADDLVAAIAAHRPGQKIALTVDRLSPAGRVTVQAELAKNPKTGKAQLGVSLESRPKYDFPVKVDIDSGQVGGPSAGLAFTLALIDRLTPGDLTGKRPVAVTGTIELDGSVGPVGGVVQKTEAAYRAGAKLFIVPTDEYADAKKAARGRLQVRQVTDVDQALKILRQFGGDPVPATGADG